MDINVGNNSKAIKKDNLKRAYGDLKSMMNGKNIHDTEDFLNFMTLQKLPRSTE